MIRTGQLLADIAQSLGYEVVSIDLFGGVGAGSSPDKGEEGRGDGGGRNDGAAPGVPGRGSLCRG